MRLGRQLDERGEGATGLIFHSAHLSDVDAFRPDARPASEWNLRTAVQSAPAVAVGMRQHRFERIVNISRAALCGGRHRRSHLEPVVGEQPQLR